MNNKIIFIKPLLSNLIELKPGQVLQLHKALYRLKQARQCWYKTLCQILNTIGFTQSEYDFVVFYTKKNKQTVAILLIHVNNITIVAQSNNIIDMIKNSLQSHIEITDRGKLH